MSLYIGIVNNRERVWSLEVYFMRMWWYEFVEQTEEWYEVHGTGNGTGGCRVCTSSCTDDTLGHMTGWRWEFFFG